MKSEVTFRRHALGQVIVRTNEDRHSGEVVPFGRFGAGEWTGHPIGLVVVLGMLFLEVIALPQFFAAQLVLGGLVGFFLRRYHQAGLVICVGLIVIALIGVPALRWFFGATILAGSVVGYFFWRRHQTKA